MASRVETPIAEITQPNLFINIVSRLSVLAGWTASAMILAAVAITCQMIFVRFLLNGSTVWQTEAVIYLVIAATLIGLPFVQHLKGHVNVDLIPMALPAGWRRGLGILTHALSCAIAAVMFLYGAELWHLAWSRGWQSDTVWAVRLWIPYLALPLGFGLLFLQLAADLARIIQTNSKSGES